MKIEIEITDEMVREVVGNIARNTIACLIRGMDTEKTVRNIVTAKLPAAIDESVKRSLSNIPLLEKEVKDEIKRQLKARIKKLSNIKGTL